MTAPARTSAYPLSVDELLPSARSLAERLGQTPTRNRLMNELRIGAPKAAALLDLLTGVGADAPTPTAEGVQLDIDGQEHPIPPREPTPKRLHLVPEPTLTASAPVESEPLVTVDVDPGSESVSEPSETASENTLVVEAVPVPLDPVRPAQRVRTWPVWVLALPAFVAVWSGWVGLGELTGFGVVHPLPGIYDNFSINTAITLPIGVETYGAFALRAWLSPFAPARARRFARWSAIGSLALGAAGQVAYHLMSAAGVTHAPWPITTAVACLPVAVLGMGAALAHLMHADKES